MNSKNINQKVKIGIVGSRRRDSLDDFANTAETLANYCEDNNLTENDICLVSGGCKKGGDRFAEVLAKILNVEIILHLPDKSTLPENPKYFDFAKLNFDRNTLIARDSDILIACVADNRKGGTEDTIKKFNKMHPGHLLILC